MFLSQRTRIIVAALTGASTVRKNSLEKQKSHTCLLVTLHYIYIRIKKYLKENYLQHNVCTLRHITQGKK